MEEEEESTEFLLKQTGVVRHSKFIWVVQRDLRFLRLRNL